MHKHANTRAPSHKMWVKGPRSQKRKHQPCMCTSSNHAPPARRDKEGEQRLERHDGSAIFSSYLLIQREKKSVKSLLFLTQKGAEECLKFREGWRVWNLSPRGQTDGFFSFQALIDSPLSSLATQKDTWKNFWWGCDVRNRVTCSADALSWFLTSTSARQCQYSWTFQLFLLLHTGEDFKTLFPAFMYISTHPSLHFKDESW